GDIDKVRGQPHHDDLSLGVSETAIVLDHFRSIRGQHQPDVQKPLEGTVFLIQACERRLDDLPLDQIKGFDIDESGSGERAHSTGIWTGVVIFNPLVVLGWSNQFVVAAVGEKHERGFATGQAFFDYNARSGVAEDSRDHHLLNGFVKLRFGRGDPHTFARSETIGLDHDWDIEIAREVVGGTRYRIADGEASSRYAMALHELLCEYLTAFQPRGSGGRADDPQAFSRELVGDPGDEGSFGSDDGELRTDRLSQIGQDSRISGIDGNALGDLCDACVTRRAKQCRNSSALFQLPDERVLAATGSYDEDFHRGMSRASR